MKIELDYKKGDKVICLIDGKLSLETITGRCSIFYNEGENPTARYEIDRKDKIFTTTNIDVSAEMIFRTKKDAMHAIGLDEIQE